MRISAPTLINVVLNWFEQWSVNPEGIPNMGAGSESPKQRIVRRCPFVASAEVIELSSEARRTGRTSELGVGGCYIAAPDPFPKETVVRLRIFRGEGVFETKAKVVYSHHVQLNSGMGLAFVEMAPNQRSLLEGWLAEVVIKLSRLS